MAKAKATPMEKPSMRKRSKGKHPSTQHSLYISEVKNDVVTLKDGTLRGVLQVSSINFALKSEDEQQAIIQGYISFLNSIDFEIEIVIQSRKLDIRPYLTKLDAIAKEQANELLKVQTIEYKQYIQDLVDLSDIMEKKFIVVVPYSPFSKKRKNFWSRAQEVLLPGRTIVLHEKKFEKYRKELDRRISIAAGGLTSIGLQVTQMDTQQLIELYYQMYNPTRGSSRIMPDLNKLRVEQNAQA